MDRLLIYNDDRHDFDGRLLFALALPPRPEKRSKLRWHLPDGFEPMNGPAFYNLWQGSDPGWAEKKKALERKRAAEAEAHPELSGEVGGPLMQGLRVQ